jgi:solute carrier family 35 protein F5
LTYFNTTCFIFALVPVFIRSGYQRYRASSYPSYIRTTTFRKLNRNRNVTSEESQAFLKPDNDNDGLPDSRSPAIPPPRTHIGLIPTARLSLAFCILWFSANYFAMACLQHTTVASTTILTSTSSIWTLLIGACTHTERFTLRKLLGVLASFIGIVLVSHADLTTPHHPQSNNPSSSTGSPSITNPFPTKPASELFLGDTLAFLSAIIYGAYTITLKRTTIRCAPLQLNMPLFFGLVGLCNALLLFPLFPLLHYTHIERFQLPPTSRIWKILMMNSAFSLFSDICWAYAMVLTSPLVVTVGLSLTIPLSLVGEMVLQGRKEGLVYWLGALVVVGSFVFVDREEVKEDKKGDDIGDTNGAFGDSVEDSIDANLSPRQRFGSSEDLPR